MVSEAIHHGVVGLGNILCGVHIQTQESKRRSNTNYTSTAELFSPASVSDSNDTKTVIGLSHHRLWPYSYLLYFVAMLTPPIFAVWPEMHCYRFSSTRKMGGCLWEWTHEARDHLVKTSRQSLHPSTLSCVLTQDQSVLITTLLHEYSAPIFKLSPHFDLNCSPVRFHDCILHRARRRTDKNLHTDICQHKVLKNASVMLSFLATADVSTATFCYDDTHTCTQREKTLPAEAVGADIYYKSRQQQ